MLEFSKTSEGHMKVRRHRKSFCVGVVTLGTTVYRVFLCLQLRRKPDGEKDALAKAVKSAGRAAWTASTKDAMTRRFVLFLPEYRLFLSNICFAT